MLEYFTGGLLAGLVSDLGPWKVWLLEQSSYYRECWHRCFNERRSLDLEQRKAEGRAYQLKQCLQRPQDAEYLQMLGVVGWNRESLTHEYQQCYRRTTELLTQVVDYDLLYHRLTQARRRNLTLRTDNTTL